MADPTTQYVYQSGFPPELAPYLQSLVKQASTFTDITKNPYQQYTGERVAQFSPLQQQAFAETAKLGPATQLQTGTDYARLAGLAGLSAAYSPTAFTNQFAAPSAYQAGQFGVANVAAPSLQNYQMGAPANVAAERVSTPTMGAATTSYAPRLQSYLAQNAPQITTPTMQGATTGFNPNLQAYQMSPGEQVAAQAVGAPTMQGATTAYNPNLRAFQMGPAQQVAAQTIGAPTMQGATTAYNPNLKTFQMGPAQQVGTQSFLAGKTAQDYMSPYMQNVVNVQQQEARRQAGIQQTALDAQAAQAGAFGGSRQAIQRGQAARDLQTNLSNIQAQGLQSAYAQGQQQFNTEQQNRLQAAMANQQAGLTTGQQNLAAQLQTQQLGTQTGLQTALANLTNQQQAAVQNQAIKFQAQGMNAQQALQAALANQQAGLTTGAQNLASQLQTQQLGTQTGLQTALANLTNQQQAAVQNQAIQFQAQGMNSQQALQAALANQQAGLTAGQQNLAARLGVQQLGTQTGLQTALANLTNQQQAAVQNQAASLQAQGMNSQQALQVALANQQAQLGTQQLGTQTGLQTALANLTNQQQAAVQNQAAALQAQGMNSQQALQAALANQTMGYNVGQQNLASRLQTQQLGAQTGLQAALANQQAQQAAQQALEASRQFGYGQNMAARQLQAQYGLSAQQAAEASRQFGANFGLQGAQTGLQAASIMGTLGQQQQAQQIAAMQARATLGQQQQQAAQDILNAQYQDWLNYQNFPYKQMGIYSDILRGTPLTQTGTSLYQAPPTAAQSFLSAGLGAAGLGSLFGGKKEGGTVKSYANGGQVQSYGTGGSVFDQGFKDYAVKHIDPRQLPMAQRNAVMRGDVGTAQAAGDEMSLDAAIRRGIAAAAPYDMDHGYADGGIVAFATGGNTRQQMMDYLSQSTEDIQMPTAEERLAGIGARRRGLAELYGESEVDPLIQQEIQRQQERMGDIMQSGKGTTLLRMAAALQKSGVNPSDRYGAMFGAAAEGGEKTQAAMAAAEDSLMKAKIAGAQARQARKDGLTDKAVAAEDAQEKYLLEAKKLKQTAAIHAAQTLGGIEQANIHAAATAAAANKPTFEMDSVKAKVNDEIARDPTLKNDPKRLAAVTKKAFTDTAAETRGAYAGGLRADTAAQDKATSVVDQNLMKPGPNRDRYRALQEQDKKNKTDTASEFRSSLILKEMNISRPGGAGDASDTPAPGVGAPGAPAFTAGSVPTLQQFLPAARKANPGVSDDALKAYYANKYGR